jgi:hypothetical protein
MLVINEPLQIADQMRPAELPLPVSQCVVGTSAIRLHEPWVLIANQLPQRMPTPARINPKAGGAGTDGDP